MQRIDGPPPDRHLRPSPEPPQQQQQAGREAVDGTMPTGFTNTGNHVHTQSFEEIYGIPENFLEIEVGYALFYETRDVECVAL